MPITIEKREPLVKLSNGTILELGATSVLLQSAGGGPTVIVPYADLADMAKYVEKRLIERADEK